jgi:hypothetical protein
MFSIRNILNVASKGLKMNFILATEILILRSSGALRPVNYSLTQNMNKL